jgi:olefin beta-lactone synthetase
LVTGGGPVFPDLVQRLLGRAPEMRVVSVYGSTEAEPIAHADANEIGEEDWTAMRNGAGLLAGTPASGARVRIVDDEILVAGDHVVQAYLDPAHDASTKVRDKDGTVWHRTGDGGRFDGQGRLWLRGRLKARVGSLWPFEVEAPARFWPGVRLAALAEVGETPVLAIEGDKTRLGDWQSAARALGIDQVIPVRRIPLDRRHGSKVDQAALTRRLRRTLSRRR